MSKAYLPDGINLNSLTRNFLLTVSIIYNILGSSNGLTTSLVRHVFRIQKKMASQISNKWDEYEVQMPVNWANIVANRILSGE